MRLKPTLKPGTLPHLNSRSLFCETSNLAVEIESTTPKEKGLTLSTSISLYGCLCEIEAALVAGEHGPTTPIGYGRTVHGLDSNDPEKKVKRPLKKDL
jgi:hypothetical protein